jgi:hypothetical protein
MLTRRREDAKECMGVRDRTTAHAVDKIQYGRISIINRSLPVTYKNFRNTLRRDARAGGFSPRLAAFAPKPRRGDRDYPTYFCSPPLWEEDEESDSKIGLKARHVKARATASPELVEGPAEARVSMQRIPRPVRLRRFSYCVESRTCGVWESVLKSPGTREPPARP